MKRTLLYIGSVVVLILSAITFIFVPSMLDRTSGSAHSLGTYDGKKIELIPGTPVANSLATFDALYKEQLSQVDQYPAAQQKYVRSSIYYQMYSNAFNAAISFLSAAAAVKQSGYAPSAIAISREMLPYFSDENGYSARIYNAVSESQRNDIRKDVTNRLIWQHYFDDYFGTGRHTQDAYFIGLTCMQNYSIYMQQARLAPPNTLGGYALYGLKASDEEQEFLAAMGTEKRSFDMVAWNKTAYPDQEVIAYGVDHYELFNTHDVSVITVDSKAEAEKLLAQITNNELTFDDALSEFSQKYYTDADGKLTSHYEYQIKEIIPDEGEFNAVIDLDVGAVSGVIQTANNSYALFRRNEKRGLNQLNVEENIDVVRNYLDTHEAGIAETYYVNLAKDFAADAVTTSFDAASRKFKVTKIAVPAFALNYGNALRGADIPSDIAELNGASRNEHFLQTAFSLKTNEISEPIVLGENVLVLKLTGEQTAPVTEADKIAVVADCQDYDVALFQTKQFDDRDIKSNVYEFISQNVVAD
ncbi:MAG: peptidyl-prolyl cis-trans isomerase [Treponemataceae bacterium]|nr:peptidyl-prolyl cis-trans isomerase [Treponemataceae bacterium]